MPLYDVVVVGGGPIGCMTAYFTAKSGFKTLVVEEHREIGKPVHCSGKVCVKAFEEFNLSKTSIVNKVRGAYFYSPDNKFFSVSKPTVESYIVDREIFDKDIAKKAEKAGAEILTSTKCYKLEKDKAEYNLRFRCKSFQSSNSIKCKAVVDAEGWKPILLENLKPKKGIKFLAGIQVDMENVEFNRQDHVELYFGGKFFPGFFGWIIPLDKEKARVGLCVNKLATKYPPSTYLKLMLEKHPIVSRKVKQGRIKKVFGGIIPIHGPLNVKLPDGFFVVGDAAGHVKSTTGGGIYFGLKMAKITGEAITKFLTRRGKENFSMLESWKISFEIKFTSFLRKFLDKLSDEDLNILFKVLREEKNFLKKIEEKYYSQDQFKIFLLTLKNPKIILKLKNFTPKLLISLFDSCI